MKIFLVLQNNAETAYKKVINLKDITIQKSCGTRGIRCGLCGGTPRSFQLYHNEFNLSARDSLSSTYPRAKEKVILQCSSIIYVNECGHKVFLTPVSCIHSLFLIIY